MTHSGLLLRGHSNNTLHLSPVIPNRGAAAPRVKVSRVPHNLEILLIDVLPHKVPPNCHFNQLEVPPIFFEDLKGAANQKKRLENKALVIKTFLLFKQLNIV